MTILENDLSNSIQVRRFTSEEYYHMYDQGFFDGQRVELIDGEILVMAAMKDPHASTIVLLTRLFARALPENFDLRPQLPLSVARYSEPEPDIAIVANEPGVKRGEHPCTAKLVIEVADTSLRLDRAKANLYASAAVNEYWIVNLPGGKLHVFREPVIDAAEQFGARYVNVSELGLEKRVIPVAVPVGELKVAGLFPAQ